VTRSSISAASPLSARQLSARWLAITVFVFSSVLNYLDRQVLATMVEIWRARPDFPFTYSDYGLLLAVFSIAYAVSALFVGWFIDRVGLNRGITVAVAVWAVASLGTGTAHSSCGARYWAWPKRAASPPSRKPSACIFCPRNARLDKRSRNSA